MKKNILLCAMLLAGSVVRASDECSSACEQFSAQQFKWTYMVQAQDCSDLTHFNKFQNQMHNMIDDMNRSVGSNIYQQMIVFIKELQEAIVAGWNLFGTVMTTQESITDLAVEAAEVVTEEIVAEQTSEEKSTEDATKEVTVDANSVKANPMLTISLSCTLVEEAQRDLWNLATAQLQDLADSMNNKSINSAGIEQSLTNLYEILAQIKGSGMRLSITN